MTRFTSLYYGFAFLLHTSLFVFVGGAVLISGTSLWAQNLGVSMGEVSADSQTWQYRYNQNHTIWNVETPMNGLKEIAHQFNDSEGYSRQGCEFFNLEIPESAPLYLGAAIPSGELGDDVAPSLFIKSDRTDYKLFLRVILPNECNENGEPLSFWLEGTTYSASNKWQQLRVEKPKDQLVNQVHALEIQRSRPVNTDKVFYDKFFLNLGGGKGTIKVWIDDLEVCGYRPVDANQLIVQGQQQYALANNASPNPGSSPNNEIVQNPGSSPNSGALNEPAEESPVPLQVTPLTESSSGGLSTGLPTEGRSSDNGFNNNPVVPGTPADTAGSSGITPALSDGGLGNSPASGVDIPGGNPAAPPSFPGRESIAEHKAPDNFAIQGAPGNIHGAVSESGSDAPQDSDQNSGPKKPTITYGNSVISINGESFYPRAIRFRGEPLDFLKKLGFNTIWLSSPPSEAFQTQARELGLWIIAAPPLDEVKDLNSYSLPSWNDRFPQVIAWDMGAVEERNISSEDLMQQKNAVKSMDNLEKRPVIALVRNDLFNYSRSADIVLLEKPVIHSSLTFRRLLQWETTRMILTGKASPFWSVITTQPDPALLNQWKLMFPENTYPSSFPVEQLFLNVMISAYEKRALLFDSYTPLDREDPDTVNRRKSLEFINHFIAIIDSFLVKGKMVVYEDQNDPQRRILVCKNPDRGLLAVSLYLPDDAQYVVNGMSRRGSKILIPGVPNTYQTFHISPNGLEPVSSSRQAGGVQFQVDNQENVSFYLLSQEPLVISSMSHRLRLYGERIAQLKRELTYWRLVNIRQWIDFKRASAKEMGLLNEAQRQLEISKTSFERKLYSNAYFYANIAAQNINALEYSYWLKGSGTAKTPNMHPAAVCFRSMRLYHQWQQESIHFKLGENMLNGGDFEDPAIFTAKGEWRNICNNSEQAYAAAELSPAAALAGKFGLRLVSWPKKGDSDVVSVVTKKSPVKIKAPPIKATPGDTVRISMMVNIPQPIVGTLDGLIIRDEGSGEILQTRISKTLSWDRVVLFRSVDQSGEIRIVLELTGYGEAWIDNVRVFPVVPRVGSEAGDVNQE